MDESSRRGAGDKDDEYLNYVPDDCVANVVLEDPQVRSCNSRARAASTLS